MKDRKIYILLGASGSGKTFSGQYLKELGIPELVSHTTRAMRKGEIPGVTYHYVTKEEFDSVDKIEWTEYPKDSGRFYCLSRHEVQNKLAQGGKYFAVVDSFGVQQLKEQFPNDVVIIYFHIPIDVMVQRMKKREDSEEAIKERLWQMDATNELSNYVLADYVIENMEWEDTKKRLRDIVSITDKKEVERKFLVKKLPELSVLPNKEIVQGYISFEPETRIGKEGDKFYLTHKSTGDLVREEKSEEISEEKFQYYACMILNNFIEKTRYYALLGNQVGEIDVYHKELNRLITVEVEFLSEEEAKQFVPPAWVGEEVTYDKRYKNKNLAQNGLPVNQTYQSA
ncbi:hypothetical protein PP175_27815 (plasmid) [Aneurinibacillus sp. Ricciae_BoGa-3]|uniref:hypothetical protein n=1 Tax=Aneurinibacillus sp. Ricciae_BoGa-3 TaxID=3022697 RepID=UPI002341BE73|nr:hypothetical protein [Aneurinibacillus sp. Ricciae_BoGa-3]WCK57000.1 hypothetical protein PP175_27815 [Aneurinibacillus sp. Ricciae_BoGa-3]